MLFQLYAILLAAALTEDSAQTLDPDTAVIDSRKLDSQDRGRYKLTYCSLNKNEGFGKRFDLARSCWFKAKFFGTQICVEDPEDADAYVEGTCNDLVRIHNLAEVFCRRTTTTPKPTTSSESDDYYAYEEAPEADPTTTTTTEIAVRPKPHRKPQPKPQPDISTT